MLCKNATIDQDVDEDCSLNIFEMITSTNEPTKEFVNRKLLMFKRFQNGHKKCQMSFLMVREACVVTPL